MTRQRFVIADLDLYEQAEALGQPANLVALETNYRQRRNEEQEQIWFVEWCAAQLYVHTDRHGDKHQLRLSDYVFGTAHNALLREGKTQEIRRRMLGSMGCRPGQPNLVVHIGAGDFRGMFILMKQCREKFGSSADEELSPTPTETAFLNGMHLTDHHTAIAYGWKDAAKKTCLYLGLEPDERGL